MGAPAPPGRIFRRNLQGKFASAPHSTSSAPPRQSKSQFVGHFLEIWRWKLLDFSISDRLLRARSKKGRQIFEEKSAPQTKSWLRLY